MLFAACSGDDDSDTPATATPDLAQTPAQRTPVPSITANSTAAPTETAAEAARDRFLGLFAPAPDTDPADIAGRLRPSQEVADLGPVAERETLMVIDLDTTVPHEVDIELLAESEHAYFLVDEAVGADVGEVEGFAGFFEDAIYDEVTPRFGPVPEDAGKAGVVITQLSSGVAGYFAADDLQPREVNPYSNEGLFLYVDAALLDGAGGDLGGVVAHEFTHLIHSFADAGEDSWVDEGSAEVANELITGSPLSIFLFEEEPDLQLNAWGVDGADTSASYGSSHLFIRYLLERTGGLENAEILFAQPGDGLVGIAEYLAAVDSDLDVEQLYSDWLVASLLDEGDGPYAHEDIDFEPPRPGLRDDVEETVNQFAADYFKIQIDSGRQISFKGALETDVLAGAGAEAYLWSNRGDSIDSRLTASLEVSQSDPTLSFETLFRIEEGWDFGYIEVSTDDGESWTFLESELSSPGEGNPQALGPGYSGDSGAEWQRQEVDLGDYAGDQILIRFEYITDAAVHSDGWGLRNVEVGGEELEFETEGWVEVPGRVPQHFLVQLVIVAGDEVEVELVALDDGNEAVMELPGDYDEAYLVVSAVSPDSTRQSSYSLTIE